MERLTIPELEVARRQEHPLSASEGGDNVYYLDHCAVVSHRPAYCVCLKRIKERKDGRLESSASECSAAIGKKTCPAMGLLEEEVAAGKALYFIPRELMRSTNDERIEDTNERFSKMRPSKESAAGVKKPKPTPEKVTKPDDLFAQSGGYAEVITLVAAKEAEKPVEPKTPFVAPAVRKPSGGLMAVAKQMSTQPT